MKQLNLDKVGVPFAKMHGLGNDYVYIDLVSRQLDTPNSDAFWSELSRRVSDRHFGIGSDGVILILPGQQAEFAMRIFNADGSEGRMCGNGVRCLGKYVYDHGLTTQLELGVETLAGTKRLQLHPGARGITSITVDMGAPGLHRQDVPMQGSPKDQVIDEVHCFDGQEVAVTAVSMGNPHCVLFVDDVDRAPVRELGPVIEHSPLFPERTNVEFVSVLDEQRLRMRVWERGSGETMACGTGACATLVATHLSGRAGRKAVVELPGGTLDIAWDAADGHVYMTGPAVEVYQGVMDQSLLEGLIER